MSLSRFFTDDLSGDQMELGEEESHHLQHVLRIRVGEQVELFDGRGGIAEATVTKVKRRCATVSLTRRYPRLQPSSQQLTVAVSPPKGDRFRWLVEKLTEVGVTRLTPLLTERGVVSPRDSKLAKLRQTMLAAARQSRRAFLMDITEPATLAETLNEPRDSDQLWIAHPRSEDISPTAHATIPKPDGCRTLLIGPEGGFTDEEVSAARAAGAHCLSWPGTILRVETAALVFATMLLMAPETT